MDQYLKLSEAMKLAGVSRKTLLRRIASGDLPARRSGTSRNSQYLVTADGLARCFPEARTPERVA